MPLTAEGKKVLAEMRAQYGDRRGEEVFYRTMNKREKRARWEKRQKKKT